MGRSTSVAGADWPQLLGATRNGVYAAPDLADSWPKEGPSVLWQKKVGQGFSGPVVATGKLVLFHRQGDKEVVECLDASDGRPFWRFDYASAYKDDFGFDEGPRATPTIAKSNVFTFGAEGVLNCLDLATGKRVWSVDAKKAFRARKGFFGIACSPLVQGDALIINVGGSDGAGIVGFDHASGKVLWKTTDDEASYSSPTGATLDGKPCALVLTRNGLVGVDPLLGKVRFQFPFRPPMQASVTAATPLVIDDLLFISASYGTGAALLQVKGDGVEKRWAADNILSNHYATAVHQDGFLYGFDGRQEEGCNLRCVELRTGKVRWSQDRFGAGTIMLAGSRLLILTEKGELICAPATPTGFKPTARAQILSFQVRAYPALADGLFYARSKDTLVCVDLRERK
ncbi:MAG TPA: PQQ-binding-like beta-propeller repeat protein [Verrucomicrobiae bacterium]|nr:PQQ-binding-like beta-propeller repeat protein [Verrucomicrobiae bacterium]